MSETVEELKKILSPKSIAVIGASRTHMKIGHETLLNVLIHRYEGEVYPINPNAHEIMGLKCYPSVLEVPDEIDMALITVPARAVPKVMRECAKKGIKGAIIISAGFSEVGDEGKKLEDEVLKIAKEGGVRIIGPNTMGYKSPVDDLDAGFVFGMPYKGPIGLASQSGALCLGMIHHANMEKIGLSRVISVGNKVDIDDADLIEYFDQDKYTKVIAMYIEGIKDGGKFYEAAKKCSKPIVAIKSGRTKSGALAASTHTGSLSGSDRIYDSVFKQADILRADDTVELFDLARALAYQPPADGNKIGIVSNGGGAGILLTDFCEMYGLDVPSLEEETIDKIKKMLPPLSTPRNPVDVLGDAGFYRYEGCGRALLDDKNIDALIITCVHAGYARPREYAGAVMKLVQEQKKDSLPDKPIVACWIGGEEINEVVIDLKMENIPVYPSTSRAVKAMKALVEEGKRKRRLMTR